MPFPASPQPLQSKATTAILVYDFTSTVCLSSITPIIRTSQLVHHRSCYGERNQRYYLDQERITYGARVSIIHRTLYGDHPQWCNLLLHHTAYGYCHHLYHRTPYGDILIRINHHSYRCFYGDFTLTLHRYFYGVIIVRCHIAFNPILYSNRIQDRMPHGD